MSDLNNQLGAQSSPDYEPVPAFRHSADQEKPIRHKAEKPVKQSRDRAQYVRQQKGHSFVMEWFVLGIFTCFVRPIYLAVSPNHYFHF